MKENDSTEKDTEQSDPFDLEELTLIDDIFFSTVLNDNKVLAEEILEPIFREVLGEELGKITSVKTQVTNKHLKQHGVVYDSEIKTDLNQIINFEVQKKEPFELMRSNAYRSSHEIDTLNRGEDYSKLAENDFYQIILCDNDSLGRGNMVEVLKTTYQEDNEVVPDGITRVFIYTKGKNLHKEKYKDTQSLLRDFTENDIDKIKSPVIKNTHILYKQGEKEKMQLTRSMKNELKRREAIIREEFKKSIESKDKEIESKDKEIESKDKDLKFKDKRIRELEELVATLTA